MIGLASKRPRAKPAEPEAIDLATAAEIAVQVPLQAGEDVRRLAWKAMRDGFVDFYNSNNLTFAASIAYYTLLSLFPFILLVLSFVSRLAVGAEDATGQPLLHIIIRALPSRFEFLTNQVPELAASALNLSFATIPIMLWAAMGMFGALTSAVNHAWGVEKDYGFFKHKLIAFVLLLSAGILTVLALLVTSFAQIIEARWFSGVLERFPELYSLTGFAYRNAATFVFIFVIGFIYYFVPNTRVRLRDVWFGAVLAGLLWRLLFSGFAWYVRDLSRFNVHGSVAAVVVFLLWVYLSAVIFLYGVEVTAAWARLRKAFRDQRKASLSAPGPRPEPTGPKPV
jgi:membrane protein